MKKNIVKTAETMYKPNISWFQEFDKVIIIIHEVDLIPKTAAIEIFFKKMSLRIEGKNGKKYKVEIDFFSDIFKEVKINDKERYLKLIVIKKEMQIWPRLTREKEVFSWITCDAMNFNEEDEFDNIIEQNADYDYELKQSIEIDKEFKKQKGEVGKFIEDLL